MSPDLSRALSEAAGTAEDLPDLQLISQRTSAIVRRRWLGRAVILGIVVTAFVVAANTLDLNLSSPVVPATRPDAPRVHELEAFTGLRPGLYRTAFDPPFGFRITSEGWLSGAAGPTWTYLTRDRIHLHFQRWDRVVDPAARSSGADALRVLPSDLEAWFLDHPLLEVTNPETVTIGGLVGTRMDVRVAGPVDGAPAECEGTRCLLLARIEKVGEMVDLLAKETARFYVLDGATGPVVIHWAAAPAAFDVITPEMERLVASIDLAD